MTNTTLIREFYKQTLNVLGSVNTSLVPPGWASNGRTCLSFVWL